MKAQGDLESLRFFLLFSSIIPRTAKADVALLESECIGDNQGGISFFKPHSTAKKDPNGRVWVSESTTKAF